MYGIPIFGFMKMILAYEPYRVNDKDLILV